MNLSTLADTDIGTVLGIIFWIGTIVFGIVKHAKQQAAKREAEASAIQDDLAATSAALEADRLRRAAEAEVPMAMIPTAMVPVASAPQEAPVAAADSPEEPARNVPAPTENPSARRRLNRLELAVVWREVFRPPLSMREPASWGGAA